MVNGAARSSPPTIQRTVPTNPGLRPAASSIECRRNAVVVFPFVPVTASDLELPARLTEEDVRRYGHRRARILDDQLGNIDVEHPLHHECRGTPLDRLPGKIVAVDLRARDAEEQRALGHSPRVVGEVADHDRRPGSGHLARGERPDQGVEIHSVEARGRLSPGRRPNAVRPAEPRDAAG